MFWMAMMTSPCLAGEIGVSPTELLHEARRSLRDLDLEGVRMYTQQALDEPGSHHQEAHYLMGLAWQLDDRPEAALLIYTEALARAPIGSFHDQLEFGIAETTAATGDPKRALRWLRKARRGHDMSVGDEPKFAINKALFLLQKGRLRRGTKRLLEALDRCDHDLATWHQARARTFLVEQWLDFADAMNLDDPDQLERRALLLKRAQQQVLASTHLPHERYMLAQLYRLGLSYERLGDDVVSQHGRPADLPDEARQRVENVWVKASRTYDMGVRHAARTSAPDEQERFERVKQVVIHKVDLLSSAPGGVPAL